MATVRYRVPYEIAVNANDLGSGKKVSNLYYVRSAFATGPPPAYGDPIVGSSLATLLAAFVTAYETNILPILNHNYSLLGYVMRAILGKQYKTPFQVINVLIPGAPIEIQTMLPHGLSTGNAVYVQGVTNPPSANGVRTITVLNPTAFTLNGSNDAIPWSNDGQFQFASGAYQFAYGDKTTQTSAAVGTVAGDALPLFSAASVRRNNIGVGKAFRSRVSLSPMSESDSVDGGLVGARITAINAAFAAFNINYNNGGTDITAGVSAHVAISKKIASALPLVFPSENPWSVGGVTFSVQRNLGSMIRRKPRLTGIII